MRYRVLHAAEELRAITQQRAVSLAHPRQCVAITQESNDKLKGDRDALFDIGSASAEQLKSEVEYYRRENLRHVDELEEEKRRWIEGTANLRQEILNVRAEVETKRSEARSREAELKAEIVALNQKLAGLEEFRDQEHAIRKQLGEVQTQLAQCEAMYVPPACPAFAFSEWAAVWHRVHRPARSTSAAMALLPATCARRAPPALFYPPSQSDHAPMPFVSTVDET